MKYYLIALFSLLLTLPAFSQSIKKNADGSAQVFFKDGGSAKVPFYESGTWTPVWTNSLNLTGTGTFANSTWWRVGDRVFFTTSLSGITLTTAGNNRTEATIALSTSNLPYRGNELVDTFASCRQNTAAFIGMPVYVDGTTTSIDFFFNANTGLGVASATTITCPSISGSYLAKL